MSDTIFALATARGVAGIAVIRVSGPMAFETARSMTGTDLPEPRRAVLRRFVDETGEMIDLGLLILFEGGSSFTGEAVAEFHVHGSPAVTARMGEALSALPGLREAEPGEFTRRAFERGRMDLAEVEGLGDLLEAETEAQRKQALRVMRGALSGLVAGWRDRLVRARALVEACIDFSDDDVPDAVPPEVFHLLHQVRAEIAGQLRGFGAAERIRAGFDVAVVGPPNAGKSSLVNALVGREVSIVTPVPGTTRDVIEARLDIRGMAVTLLDLAGLRNTDDPVERIGVARAVQRAETADLRLFLGPDSESFGVEFRDGDIRVSAKADLGVVGPGIAVSAVTGEGLRVLVNAVAEELSRRASGAGLVTRNRQRESLARAAEALDGAVAGLEQGQVGLDLAAEDLRLSCRALESVLGRVDVEEILDEVFASFCLGK